MTQENYVGNTLHEKEFGENKIPSLFKKYAVPGIISMLFISAQIMIDGLIVSNMLGATALAGVNIVSPLYSLLMAVIIVIGIGSQTLVSIGQGEGDYVKSKNAMTTGIATVTGVCILLGIVLIAWDEPIVKALGANENLVPFASDYLRGIFVFIVGIGYSMFNDYMLRSLGKPSVAMLLMSSAVILNTLLSIVFIQFTNMGVYGVGLATTIAFSISGLISTLILVSARRKIRLFSGKVKTKVLAAILYNGSSEGVNEFAAGITVFLFNVTLMEYVGQQGVEAFAVINYIYLMGICLLIGSSDAIIPIMSFNYGAKKFNRCRKLLHFTAGVNLAVGLVIALILWVFNKSIINVFFDDASADTMLLASSGAVVYAIAFLFNGFNILASGFFTAIADAKRSVIISSLRGFVIIAIMLYVIPRTIGVDYIWYAVPIAEVVTLVISFSLYRKQTRRWRA